MSDISANQSPEISVESGPVSQTATSATSQDARIEAVEEKINYLNRRAKNLENSFKRLERHSDKLGNFLITVTTGVLIVLAVILIPMGVDYFKNSWERHETLKEMILNMRSDIRLLNSRVDSLERVK